MKKKSQGHHDGTAKGNHIYIYIYIYIHIYIYICRLLWRAIKSARYPHFFSEPNRPYGQPQRKGTHRLEAEKLKEN